MTEKKSFLKSLPITAAAFGRTFGVKVIYGGGIPRTDGRCIQLPDVGDEIEERQVLAWLGHECGHVLATNFRALGKDDLEIVKELTNALEDPRVEREICREFGGMRFILRGFYEKTVSQIVKNHLKAGIENLPPGPVLTIYALAKGEHLLFGEACFKRAAEVYRRALVLNFGEAIASFVDREVGRIADFKSTADCVSCARRIVDFIMEKADEEAAKQMNPANAANPAQAGSAPNGALPAENASGCGQSQNRGGAGKPGSDAGNSAEAQGGKEGGAGEEGGAKDGAGASGMSHAERAAHIRSIAYLNSDDFEMVPGLTKTMGKALMAAAKRRRRRGVCVHVPFRKMIEARPSAEPVQAAQQCDYWQGRDMIAQAKKDCRAMQRELKRFVETQTRRRGWTAQSGIRLASGCLSRLAVNNPRVFERRVEKRGIDTAVHILVDFSGSMRAQTHGEEHAAIAMRAALALFAGFSGLQKVNPAVSIFREDAFVNLVPHGAKRAESYAEAIGGVMALGSTPLDTALVDADTLLRHARANRRITIVITDGDPNDPEATERVISELEAQGSEFFAIGIGAGAPVSQFFRHSKTIESVDDLAAALFEGAKALINQGIRA